MEKRAAAASLSNARNNRRNVAIRAPARDRAPIAFTLARIDEDPAPHVAALAALGLDQALADKRDGSGSRSARWLGRLAVVLEFLPVVYGSGCSANAGIGDRQIGGCRQSQRITGADRRARAVAEVR